jgi:formylglycine-generating enzyme required for sulfatase activity
VKGAKINDGVQDHMTPIAWTLEDGKNYGPYKVSYESSGRCYYGTVNAVKVDWHGPRVVMVALKEYVGPKTGDAKTIMLPGGETMEMIYVASGSFMMGGGSEGPVHMVTLTKGFWMGKYEVTQAQWKSVMGSNPSCFMGDKRPIQNVSWNDCQEFIRKVNELLKDGMVRLPTEAEWEFVCRAGTSGDYGGNGDLDDMGWFAGNSDDTTHPVGLKRANAWNFHDMHGNVWEWCDDWYGSYSTGAVVDPKGPSFGSCKVLRGGSWDYWGVDCQSFTRNSFRPSEVHDYVGFRLVYSECLLEATTKKQVEPVANGSTQMAKRHREGEPFIINDPLGLNLTMKWCPAGTFMMGSPVAEEGRFDNETQHQVTLTKGFWMGETEVTQGQWKRIMEGETIVDLARKALQDDNEYIIGGKQRTLRAFLNKSKFDDPTSLCGDVNDNIPVYWLNWYEAADFCRRLTRRERVAGCIPDSYEYRLPTEAEWEYACRAGSTTALPNDLNVRILGNCNVPELDFIAWYGGNSSRGFCGRGFNTSDWPEKQYPGGYAAAREVKGRQPNKWGLYDMIGNVWEWCGDWYGAYPYGTVTDPTGAVSGTGRISRGGSWFGNARLCRSAGRGIYSSGIRNSFQGFRVALAPILRK